MKCPEAYNPLEALDELIYEYVVPNGMIWVLPGILITGYSTFSCPRFGTTN